LQEHKIWQQLTCPNTSQQNGIAERNNRHLSKICRSMLHANITERQRSLEFIKNSEGETPRQIEDIDKLIIQLRRSTRERKLNPRYANAAVMEDIKEPSTFDEAYQNDEWRKAMEEEIQALKQSQT